MNFKPIVIVAGEPNSIFFEIFLKAFKENKFRSPIILICSKSLFLKQAKSLKQRIVYSELKSNFFLSKNYNFEKLNIIDVKYTQRKSFDKISSKSNNYIHKCFEIGLKIMDKKITDKFINGPISKKSFLKNKFSGITEYLAYKTKTKDFAMLIYHKNLSVAPVTTHIPIRHVAQKISKTDIVKKVKIISNFWKDKFKLKIKIGVTGLNPHCESSDQFNEDKNIVLSAVNYLKKRNYNISGPFAADTIFTKNNRKKFQLILGMYHDQVLTPIKTLFEYDPINITIGLPFVRVSPDHGPNENMLGKNSSNYTSILNSILFLDY
ncbi:4-hydroxythreonine-4-phosphate dehydrogenase PdxA [Candidatus Pelagibacter sp. HIMB1715]|uniref:4-hydroxythreonine-4-phosphate dehydrogenase PdxA n=1 Tax=Candidatus Pelagibacter sp. HIMB1715 TaxID=3413369 RepID=UPI003F84B25B